MSSAYTTSHIITETPLLPTLVAGADDAIRMTVDNGPARHSLTFQGANARPNLIAYARTLVEYILATEPKADPAQLEIQTLEPPMVPDAAEPLAAELAASLATARATKAGMDAIVGALGRVA